MKEVILEKLKAIEEQHGVTILYACESGSRAWGFASPDSDYDVRFIYMHKLQKYIAIDTIKDTIDLPVNEVLDIGGWDLKKALGLFRKSNAALYEWLQSPVIYKVNEQFHKTIVDLMPVYFSPLAGYHHYSSMAKNCLENDLKKNEVKLKKYFYALRPVLAARWIINTQTVPPMEFTHLRPLVTSNDVNAAIDRLLKEKAVSNEKYTISAVELINDFVESQLQYCDIKASELIKNEAEAEELNQFFRKQIGAL